MAVVSLVRISLMRKPKSFRASNLLATLAVLSRMATDLTLPLLAYDTASVAVAPLTATVYPPVILFRPSRLLTSSDAVMANGEIKPFWVMAVTLVFPDKAVKAEAMAALVSVTAMSLTWALLATEAALAAVTSRTFKS